MRIMPIDLFVNRRDPGIPVLRFISVMSKRIFFLAFSRLRKRWRVVRLSYGYLCDGSTIGHTSIVCYTAERSSPLRGANISNARIELLSVMTWGKLDFPMSIVEFHRLAEEARLPTVTTPSRRVFETGRKRIDRYSE